MDKSGLVGIVRDIFRKALIVGSIVVPLTFSGCEPDDPDPDPVDHSPKGKIEYSSPTTGDSPLQVHLSFSATDIDNDISTYKLHIITVDNDYTSINKVITKSTPFDTTMTLYYGYSMDGRYSVYGEVFDKKNNSDRTPTMTIMVGEVRGIWDVSMDYPKSRVYLFATPDPNDEYNKLENKLDRDNAIENMRANDITPTIPTGLNLLVNGVRYSWACGYTADLFAINSIDLGKNPYSGISNKIYDWYMGDNFDSIYVHHGTLKYMGSHKAPIFVAKVSPSHVMNYAVTGDDLRDGKSINFIETMYKISESNIQLDKWLIPLNYDGFTLAYAYKFIDYNGHNAFGSFPAVKYDLENGVLKFEATNPNIEVALTRDAK